MERSSDALAGGEDPEGVAWLRRPVISEDSVETAAKPLCRQNNWLILGLEGTHTITVILFRKIDFRSLRLGPPSGCHYEGRVCVELRYSNTENCAGYRWQEAIRCDKIPSAHQDVSSHSESGPRVFG